MPDYRRDDLHGTPTMLNRLTPRLSVVSSTTFVAFTSPPLLSVPPAISSRRSAMGLRCRVSSWEQSLTRTSQPSCVSLYPCCIDNSLRSFLARNATPYARHSTALRNMVRMYRLQRVHFFPHRRVYPRFQQSLKLYRRFPRYAAQSHRRSIHVLLGIQAPPESRPCWSVDIHPETHSCFQLPRLCPIVLLHRDGNLGIHHGDSWGRA